MRSEWLAELFAGAVAVVPQNPNLGSGGTVHDCQADTALRLLVRRIVLLALLFAAELIPISFWLDTASLAHSTGLSAIVYHWGAWTLRGIVGFAAIFVTFAYLKKDALYRASESAAQAPIRWRFLAAHSCGIAAFTFLSSVLFGMAALASRTDVLTASWLLAGISAIAFACLAFLPWVAWVQLVRSTGNLWAYALTAVVMACVAGNAARLLWQPASHVTFAISELLLKPLVSNVIADPARMVLGTRRFQVDIAPECSGLEGAGLMLTFGVMWLVLFRRECRLPQSLILIPVAVASTFLLNAVRIAALILIGDAGAEQIATRGFHSQAGWIFFNAVAVCFCIVVRSVPFFTARTKDAESNSAVAENPVAAYLLPFLAILAAGMISGAVSASFEWLYPVRFFAAAAMLWAFRRTYARLDWRCGWLL